MTTQITSFTWTINSSALLQANMTAVQTMLLAVGLTQTADTGQANPASQTYVATNSTSQGYMVFAFPDALQSTRAIHIRVEWWTDTTPRVYVRFTVGTGTNGAGVINTPNIASSANTSAPSGAYTATLNNYACYVDGTLSIVFGYVAYAGGSSSTYNNSVGGLVIDRARDANGDPNGSGYLAEVTTNGSAPSSRSLFGAASPATSASFIPTLVPSNQALTSSDGTDFNVFRHYMMVPTVRPSLGSLTYFEAELGALSPFTVTTLGESHTYLPMGRALSGWSAAPTNAAEGWKHCGAIRWE